MREVYILYGPPASGMGSVASVTAEARGIPQLTIDNMSHNAIEKWTELGKQLWQMRVDDVRASDETLCQLIAERTREEDCAKGFILDGYPCTLNQARQLDEMLLESGDTVTAAIELHVPFPSSKSSNACRESPSGSMFDGVPIEGLPRRVDDSEKSLRGARDRYLSMITPILDHYKTVAKQVDASGEVEDAVKHVVDVFDSAMDCSEHPRLLTVESRNVLIEGAYLRVSVDNNGYPQYRNIDVVPRSVFLWHDADSTQWHFSQEMGKETSSSSSCTVPEFPSLRGTSKDPTSLSLFQLRESDIIRINPFTPLAHVTDGSTHDKKFRDTAFPPDKSSLRDPNITPDMNIQWIRVDEISTPAPVLFGSTTDPLKAADPLAPIQGALADCWLICAFSNMAERQGCIPHHFIDGLTLPENGKVRVRLYDYQSNTWCVVTIDTFIPCVKMKSGWCRPLYARLGNSNPPQCWPLLLEKAYAKFDSNYYYSLCDGVASWACQASTGINHQWEFEKTRHGKWKGHKLDLAMQLAGDDSRRPMPFTREKGDPAYSNSELFHEMYHWDFNNYLMSCGKRTNPHAEDRQENGIIKTLTYSILGVFRFSGEKDEHGRTIRLVQLRNPHAPGRWNGPWSDNAPEWEAHPKIKKALERDFEHDGVFYMSYADWSDEFHYLYVAPSEETILETAKRVYVEPAAAVKKERKRVEARNLASEQMQNTGTRRRRWFQCFMSGGVVKTGSSYVSNDSSTRTGTKISEFR